MDHQVEQDGTLRRTFMKAAAAAGIVVGAGTKVAAQEESLSSDIELGGDRGGWEGISPDAISGENNPTLVLEAGTTYEVTWENEDGEPHNFVVVDGDGERLVSSDIVSDRGETQTVEFEATEEMATYYCSPHRGSMNGDVEIVGGGDGGGANGDEETEEQDGEGTEGAIETVVDVSGEPTPENLAVDPGGSLYFSITAGEVRRLTAAQTQETELSLDDAELVGELPGQTLGVEVVPDGTVYAAVQSGEETGVWRVPRNGAGAGTDDEAEENAEDGDEEERDADEELAEAHMGNGDDESEGDDESGGTADAEPFAILGAEDEVVPNGIAYDRLRDRLLVTESFGGAVYAIPLGADDPENAAELWFEDDRLSTEMFGVNGLTVTPDDDVFLAVTDDEVDGEAAGRILRVPVEADGSAGEGETFVEGPAVHGADGLAYHPLDDLLYVASILQSAIVLVSSDGETEPAATADDGLVFCSDVAFGTVPGQCNDLFICNFAPEQPEESAILRWSP